MTPSPVEDSPPGRLDLAHLLGWLRDDGIISAANYEQTSHRFAAGTSIQHPLVRLAKAELMRVGRPASRSTWRR